MLKKIFYGLLAVLVIIQFIQPRKNNSTGPFPNDITKKFGVNDNVASILKTSCYDCHSSNTVYPWYTYIQPVGWWMQNHVNDGTKELNFNEFASYKERRQRKKLEEIMEQVKEDEMPLYSYTIIHRDTKLSAEQKEALKKWCEESIALLPPKESSQQTDNGKSESPKEQ